ncbi:polyprenyl diphosphate synthase [Candidatus Magnetaquicoccus inordinatus]|uniref:polyprenyl diphosphate synthase n=1 Tax=Candidatus Magnetaquicoccus inordinatus TaxID=2496818 RepID=UPI00102AE564|nr:polyprenyl diphosphate synthase [Candidatus Magnetaquicoccus inordinatus]
MKSISLPEPVPSHIAIIMDGNRRWARKQQLPSVEGHRQGVKAVRRTMEACLQYGISTLTLYTFSSENWKRPEEEVVAIMDLLTFHLRRQMSKLIREGIHFRALGRLEALPQKVQLLLSELEEKTSANQRLRFNLAINYGGRQELVDATRELMQMALSNHLHPDQLSESLFSEHLTTHGLAYPDLMIRTGGEQRISNFLLWQMAHTELIFLPVYWPEFDAAYLHQALLEFAKRRQSALDWKEESAAEPS